ADNLVLQNLPAIVLGIPMMIIATNAPKNPWLILGIIAAYFIVLNLVLFRSFIFKRRKKSPNDGETKIEETEVVDTQEIE
ncbi:MAG: hypothetical protein HUJ61_00715, partial [Bacilli bacterium]|nr:hypothetical protein [Bacilli bacterium]